MQRITVRTVATATVEEEWTLDVPEGLDLDTQQWGVGWSAMIQAGKISVVAVENLEVYNERDRQVEKVTVHHDRVA